MEIKADRNFTISELKVAHRMKFADLKKVHAAAIEEKNHRIKAASKMLTDMHELHLELAAEIIQVKRNARLSGADVKKLKEGNTALKSRLMIQKQEMNSLIDEVRDKHNYMKSLEDKVSEYEDALDFMSNQYEDQEEEFIDIIACIDNFYSNEMTKLSPLFIKKHMVNNKKYKGAVSLLSHTDPSYAIISVSHDLFDDNTGKHSEWLPHVDKLVMEMLAYRTPPTCIQACLYTMAKTLFPHYDIVLELPSLTHIKNLRTTLWEVSKTLACYQLGHAKDWKQAHTDETRRRQTSLVNLLISFLDSDNELKTICLNGAIMCDDGTADSQCRGIISTLHDSAKLLKRWRYATLNMYPSNPDLVELIPDPATMDITRMTGGG
jgi:hypothetical protein